MKKKIIALCLTVCLAAVAVVGGTLAYFTDTDEATNTFTVGSVKIELIEQQRNNKGTALVEFENDKVLMPIVGSVQGKSATVGGVSGLPTAENYVDKIITVKNTGKSDAYMKVFVAIPQVLDNVSDAAQNVLHFNFNPASQAEGEWTAEKLEAQGVTIDNVVYNIYSRIYTTVVTKDATTATPAYIGFYLDKDVDMNADGKYTIDGEVINFDFEKGVIIPVFAQGIQAEGFESAEAAFAASGLPTNPWATTPAPTAD